MGLLAEVLNRLLPWRAKRLANGYMVHTSAEGQQTLYSPYCELEHRSEDQKVLSRAVVTIGLERVPPGHVHKGPFAGTLREAYINGIVPHVLEVYFINTSSAPLTVRPIQCALQEDSATLGSSHDVPPQKWTVAPPLVALHSNYGTETGVSFSYEYAGKRYDVKGPAKRLTADEVRQKYSSRS